MSAKFTRTTIILLKRLKILFFGFVKGTYQHMPVYHCLYYYQRSKRKKNIITQIREFLQLAFYWEEFPYTYYEYSMFLKSCQMPVSEMKTYMPQAVFDREISKNAKYMFMTENKSIFSDLLTHYRLPQPEIILKYYQESFYDARNLPITNEDVDIRINGLEYERVFLKDSLGAEGIGIHAFTKHGLDGYLEGTAKLNANYIKQNYKNNMMILQEGLKQDEQLEIMNPDCLNTFRVLTRYHNGQVKLIAAILKLGRYGNVVDNVSQGGLIIPIDVDSGSLGARARLFYDTSEMSRHPESSFSFEGSSILRWNEVKELATKAARAFFLLQYVGWDIALTDKGAMIIEGNYDPSIYAHQVGGPGLADQFMPD